MTTEGMAEYICECRVKGIGKKLSQDIVDRFGRKTFDVILNDWSRLMNVEGIGKMKAKNLQNVFTMKFGAEVEEEKRRQNELECKRSMFYHKCGIAHYLRREIEAKYGEDHAVATIERNPYQLAEDISGIGFKKADKIAETLGIIGCSFDKAKGEAIVTYNRDPREVVEFHEGIPLSKREYPSVTFTDVEDVIYVTDQNTGSYHYNGSEIERLQEVVKNDISYQTDLIVKCNQQATVIEEYAFFLRRVSPHQQWHKFMKEELELLDKKVREKFPKFDVYFGRNDNN